MVVLKEIPGEGISETPGNLLEMQTLMALPISTKSETLGDCDACKFENHHPRINLPMSP